MAEKEVAERFEGTWNGQEVSPKRVWSGHRFTDQEVEDLLAGKEIEIEAVSARTGKAFRCAGVLAELTYEGKSYIGFNRTRFLNDGPSVWCKYAFTDQEKKDLLAGKTVKGTKFIGQSGRAFKAEVKWDPKEEKIVLVEFLK